MEMDNSILMLLYFFSLFAITVAVSFEACDSDKSQLLTRIELRECFKEEWGSEVMSEDRIIDIFDRDGDGGISSAEYRMGLEAMRDTTLEEQVENEDKLGDAAFEEVDVQMRDGTVHTLSKMEFLNMHQAHMDAQQESQTETHESQTQDLTELKNKNPELGRFIDLSKWALMVMTKHYSTIAGNKGKYAHFPDSASLLELRSLPPGGSLNRGKESSSDTSPSPNLSGNFDIYVELSLLRRDGRRGRGAGGGKTKPADVPLARDIRKYEFHIIGDPLKYRLPHAAVVGCWELNNDGERIDTLELPTPRLFHQEGDATDQWGWNLATAVAVWSSLDNTQRLVILLGSGVVFLAALYFVVLPLVYFLVMLQVGKED